jgi:membrane protease YdiL (CAAX protease family)
MWGFIATTLVQGLLSGATINAVLAFGEEIAWRGFLVKVLQGKNFILAAIVIGLVWGAWHFPLVLNGHNYPTHPVIGVFMMILMCISFTPILLYFRLKSGSVIVPAIMHGTFNAMIPNFTLLVMPANDLLIGGMGLAGIIVYLLISVLIFLYDRYISKENLFMKPIEPQARVPEVPSGK